MLSSFFSPLETLEGVIVNLGISMAAKKDFYYFPPKIFFSL